MVTPERTHLIKPTAYEVGDFVGNIGSFQPIAVDIETPRARDKKGKLTGEAYMGCIGIAVSPTLSMTVPTTREYWPDPAEYTAVRKTVGYLLLRADVIMHNGLGFDYVWLVREGMPVNHFRWDTRYMHACLYPRLQHDLAFVGTTLTLQPYWKDEAKDPDEIAKYATNSEALWTYCGIDCCVTFECWQVMHAELERRGLLTHYLERYGLLFPPLLSMALMGIPTDETRRAAMHDQINDNVGKAAYAMELAVGKGIISKAGIGTNAIRYVLYGPKGLPEKHREKNTLKLSTTLNTYDLPLAYKTRKGKGGDTRTVTADEVTVRKLLLKHSELREFGEGYLGFQRASAMRKQMVEGKSDPDGRMRCTWGFTETLRLTSATNPFGTGDNLQNRDRELRDHFVPLPGHVLLSLDMSQIENRIQLMLTRDPRMIQMARTPPWELDMHGLNAAVVTGKSIADVDEVDRYLGKQTNHAVMRGMGAQTMQELLLKAGFVRTVPECTENIRRYMNQYAALEDYFRDIRVQIATHRRLASTWGDIITFYKYRGDSFDQDVFGAGYSWPPQVEGSGIINEYGVKPFFYHIGPHTERLVVLLLQVHDELLFSLSEQDAHGFSQIMQRELERPRVYYGNAMTVPVGFALGRTWGTMRKWKKLPPKEEFVCDPDTHEELP